MHQQVHKLTVKYRFWSCCCSSSVTDKKNSAIFLSSANNAQVQNPSTFIKSRGFFYSSKLRISRNKRETEILYSEKEQSLNKRTRSKMVTENIFMIKILETKKLLWCLKILKSSSRCKSTITHTTQRSSWVYFRKFCFKVLHN